MNKPKSALSPIGMARFAVVLFLHMPAWSAAKESEFRPGGGFWLAGSVIPYEQLCHDHY